MKELELLRAGRAADALAALLSRWRSTRTPVLGDAIVALGARSTDDPAAELEGKKGKDVEQRWVDLARGATDAQLSAYLAALSRHVATARFTWPIVELLAEREPDPRVAHFALETLQRIGKLRHASTKLGRRLVECVETHGDASFAAPLRKCRVTGWVQPERVKNVAARLERSGKPFEATKKELTSLLAAAKKVKRQPFGATAAPADTGAKLLAAVYANPADDAPRLVYADWLLEQGDPRGEFIRLQFQARDGTLAEKDRKRMDALQRKHQHAWLKDIWPALARDRTSLHEQPVFERGFLAEAFVTTPRRAPSDLWTRPEWSTVRALRGTPTVTEAMRSLVAKELRMREREFLASGSLPLKRLVLDASLAAAGKPWPALPVLEELSFVLDPYEADDTMALLRELRAQPAVQKLKVLKLPSSSYADWSARWDHALVDALPFERLELGVEAEDADDGAEWFVLERTSSGRLDGATFTVRYVASQGVLDAWRELLRPFAKLRPAFITFVLGHRLSEKDGKALVEVAKHLAPKVGFRRAV